MFVINIMYDVTGGKAQFELTLIGTTIHAYFSLEIALISVMK